MYLDIKSDGSLTLEETDDFGRFEIRSAINLASGKAREKFLRIAEPAENERYWIDAEALVKLSSRANDALWCHAFWAMLEKAEPYGFSDTSTKRIMSHVVR